MYRFITIKSDLFEYQPIGWRFVQEFKLITIIKKRICQKLYFLETK